MGAINFDTEADAFGTSDTNPAPILEVSGANGKIDVIAFDDTTEEEAQTYFKLPSSLDPAGSVTFQIEGFASNADGNLIRFKISYSAKNLGEVWDAAYATSNSGDKSTNAVQDKYDYTTFSFSVAALGWAPNDLVRFKLTRVAIGAGAKVVGNYNVTNMRIILPTV